MLWGMSFQKNWREERMSQVIRMDKYTRLIDLGTGTPSLWAFAWGVLSKNWQDKINKELVMPFIMPTNRDLSVEHFLFNNFKYDDAGKLVDFSSSSAYKYIGPESITYSNDWLYKTLWHLYRCKNALLLEIFINKYLFLEPCITQIEFRIKDSNGGDTGSWNTSDEKPLQAVITLGENTYTYNGNGETVNDITVGLYELISVNPSFRVGYSGNRLIIQLGARHEDFLKQAQVQNAIGQESIKEVLTDEIQRISFSIRERKYQLTSAIDLFENETTITIDKVRLVSATEEAQQIPQLNDDDAPDLFLAATAKHSHLHNYPVYFVISLRKLLTKYSKTNAVNEQEYLTARTYFLEAGDYVEYDLRALISNNLTTENIENLDDTSSCCRNLRDEIVTEHAYGTFRTTARNTISEPYGLPFYRTEYISDYNKGYKCFKISEDILYGAYGYFLDPFAIDLSITGFLQNLDYEDRYHPSWTCSGSSSLHNFRIKFAQGALTIETPSVGSSWNRSRSRTVGTTYNGLYYDYSPETNNQPSDWYIPVIFKGDEIPMFHYSLPIVVIKNHPDFNHPDHGGYYGTAIEADDVETQKIISHYYNSQGSAWEINYNQASVLFRFDGEEHTEQYTYSDCQIYYNNQPLFLFEVLSLETFVTFFDEDKQLKKRLAALTDFSNSHQRVYEQRENSETRYFPEAVNYNNALTLNQLFQVAGKHHISDLPFAMERVTAIVDTSIPNSLCYINHGFWFNRAIELRKYALSVFEYELAQPGQYQQYFRFNTFKNARNIGYIKQSIENDLISFQNFPIASYKSIIASYEALETELQAFHEEISALTKSYDLLYGQSRTLTEKGIEILDEIMQTMSDFLSLPSYIHLGFDRITRLNYNSYNSLISSNEFITASGDSGTDLYNSFLITLWYQFNNVTYNLSRWFIDDVYGTSAYLNIINDKIQEKREQLQKKEAALEQYFGILYQETAFQTHYYEMKVTEYEQIEIQAQALHQSVTELVTDYNQLLESIKQTEAQGNDAETDDTQANDAETDDTQAQPKELQGDDAETDDMQAQLKELETQRIEKLKEIKQLFVDYVAQNYNTLTNNFANTELIELLEQGQTYFIIP